MRTAYYILNEEVFEEPDYLSADGQALPGATEPAKPASCPAFKFGRMFATPAMGLTAADQGEMISALTQLGLCMNDAEKYCQGAAVVAPGDSTIPSGYTYLGQFIAHEITFDNTQGLPAQEPKPEDMRSPSIDLDSLYGAGPGDEQSRQWYDDKNPARLKVGPTQPIDGFDGKFDNDLPRDPQTGQALIGDPRNDENLAVAQTHVAFIKFHNRVVDALAPTCPPDKLFERAREEVVRHFQWLILNDYLPTIVDEGVLKSVRDDGPRWFKVEKKEDLFMPLEFSAAAFRLGHSMVRKEYQWNIYHSKQLKPPSMPFGVPLNQLFDQTAFSGGIKSALPSDWVIDWRRFFDFPEELGHKPAPTGINMAGKIDTNFDFHLDQIPGFPAQDLPPERRSITVRNLLRGFALRLPTGEQVAEALGETPLAPEEVASGPHGELLSTPIFKGRTPLWYYILKEAELKGFGPDGKPGNRLGHVGSRIVAETLVGLIQNSSLSILKGPAWYPSYGRGELGTESARFGMADLLHFAFGGAVNPIGGP
ncbi:MAG: heme peroxidase family protein [Acidobacteriota bacterium]|nr:heme peroxidase family protein [Acidobacteriota bacterium]